MTSSASAIHLDKQFDSFLFAAIGEDKDGMDVTVLSALARLNVDPWQKAAELSRLTRSVAGQKLAALIGALPDFSPASLDSGLIERLVDLLPSRVAAPVQVKGFVLRDLAHARTIVIVAALVALLIAAQFVWESSRPQPADDFGAAASNMRGGTPQAKSGQ